jgi:hypothetical protein
MQKVAKVLGGVLVGVLLILLLPVILIFLCIAFVYWLISLPFENKRYKRSKYYQKFNDPFEPGITHSPGFCFYNSAIERGLPISFFRCEDGKFEYFLLKDTIYLLPDYDALGLDEENIHWQVSYDGNWKDFYQDFDEKRSMLKDISPDTTVKVLLARHMIEEPKLTRSQLPEQICVVNLFETAFDEEKVLMDIPQNGQELYGLMQSVDDLCGNYELRNDIIYWDLYDKIHLEIGVDEHESMISVEGKVLGITHWHPNNFEVFHDVCAIGKRGNVMVIRTILGCGGVLYMGKKEDCPYREKSIFGRFYYLEAK